MGYKIKNNIVILAIVCVILSMPVSLWALSAGSLDRRVSASSDDAEEEVSSGNVDSTGSTDLELVDDGGLQIVGLRFQNITIPKNSEITNAYIVFTADETGSSVTNLGIACQSADNPPTFPDGASNNISSRLSGGETTIPWNNVSVWNTIGREYQTPDLTNIVQELVDRPGWNSGQAMVFIIGGSGTRTAESYNGSPSQAPLLHIEYTTTTVNVCVVHDDDDAEEESDGNMSLGSSDLEMVHDSSDQKVGIRFRNINVPQGAQISNAYITFTTDNSTTSGGTSLKFYGEATADASAFTSTDQDITSRDKTSNFVEWNNIPPWDTEGVTHQTPDLSSVVQEIVGTVPGWAANNDMAFIIEGSGERTAWSHDGSSAKAACLYIEYAKDPLPYITLQDNDDLDASVYEGNDPGSREFTIVNSGLAPMNGYTITTSTANGLPWLSVDSVGGSLAPGASDTVTLTYTPIAQGLGVGSYDGTITITHGTAPNSPREIGVNLTISTLPAGSSCGNVPVYTENLVSPAIMVLLDVSSSMTSLMNVSSGANNPKTPPLSTIVQELVDRPDWSSGNAMAFVITGSGHRTACSFDQSGGGYAPLLHVTYNGGTTIEPVRVSNSSDDAEESSGGNMDLGSSDLELVQESSTQTVGIRFNSVPIPPGATIDEAHIEFVIDETQDVATDLMIYGQDLADPSTFSTTSNDISSRALTMGVPWINVDKWETAAQQSRIQIGRDAISDLVKDRSISWGYGTWCAKTADFYDAGLNYTKIHVGCKDHDDPHQANLQAAVTSTQSHSGTPFMDSVIGAREYFEGNKKEYIITNPAADPDLGTESGDRYTAVDCQPMFLIDVTDGLGYYGSSVATLGAETNNLYDAGVSCVAVGFGIDNADQINEMARVANIRGNASGSDSLYALHKEIAGVGQPFLANNKEELVEALSTITETIKANIFHGSAPAPTTSADLGETVLIAKFDASDWSGDLVAITKTVGKLKLDDISGTFQDDELLASIGGQAKADGTLSGSDLDYDGKISNFRVGETVIGGTSGATGTIYYLDITGEFTGTLSLTDVSGSFVDDEDLTSVAGSATADGTVAFNQLDYGKKVTDFMLNEIVTGETSGASGTISEINIINDGYGTLAFTSVTGTRYLAYDAATTDFTVGETVTGGISAATGIIAAVNIDPAISTAGDIRLVSVSGTFNDNEGLTGSSGGAATVNGALAYTAYFEDEEYLIGDMGGAATANSNLYHALAYDDMTSEYSSGETVVGQISGATATIVDVVEIWALGNSEWSAKDEMLDPAFRSVFTVTDPGDPSTLLPYTDGLLANDNFMCKKLGDIINSTPLVVGTPPFWHEFDDYLTWKHSVDRDPVVYIGANDGFLHAISLQDVEDGGGSLLYKAGQEKWAFLPHNLQPKLDMADNPTYDMCNESEYCHQYFVDGTPVASDIYDGTDWRTILVCGENEGGEAFFALDITSGKPFDDGTDPSEYLWEFTDSDLGQTWSEPCITRVHNDDLLFDTAWGVYLTSGYDEMNQENKTAHLYGLVAHNEEAMWNDGSSDFNKIEIPFYSISYDAESAAFTVGEAVVGGTSGATGTIAWIEDNGAAGNLELESVSGTFVDNETLVGSTGGSATVDGTMRDALLNNSLNSPMGADLHQQEVSSHLYTGDLYGFMYRVSNIGKEQDPQIMRLFHFADYPSSPNTHPIRAKATYAFGDYPGYIWVYFGTGRYEDQADKTNMNQQYFFGMEDSTGLISSYVYDENNVIDPGITTLEAPYVTDPTTGHEFRYINPVSTSTGNSWAIKLDNSSPGMMGSERVIEEALVVGGIVFFTTFIPDQDVCAGNGDAWVFALDYETGMAPTFAVFDINGDGKIDENDEIWEDTDGDGERDDDEVTRIAAIPVGEGQGSKPVLFGDTLFVTTTGGGLSTLPVNLPGTRVELRYWRQN